MTRHNLIIPWDALHRDAADLARRVGVSGNFTGIVAVTRGGLVPAMIAAETLGVRTIETLSVATYRDRDRGEPVVLKPPVAAGDGTGFLVVDDLVDTGATAKIVRTLLPRAFFAVVYAKPEGKPLVDAYAVDVPQDTWLVFPWDVPPPEIG